MPQGIRLTFIFFTLLCAACEPGDLKIGVINGDHGVNGAVMAADDINAAGGVAGRPLALDVVTETYARSLRHAIQKAEALAQDRRILAVVGHSNSAGTLAAARVYNERELPHIAPNSTSPIISEAGPYTFRMVAPDRYQAPVLADELRAGERAVIAYVNDDYGRLLHRALRSELDRRGADVVAERSFLDGERFAQADDLASVTVRTGADVVYWIGRAPELIATLREIHARGGQPRVIGSDGVVNRLMDPPDDVDLSRVRYVRLHDPEAGGASFDEVSQRYEERFGIPMSDQAALSYDAVRILALVLEERPRTRGGVRDRLASIDGEERVVEGITGRMYFDENGDGPPRYRVFDAVQNGEAAPSSGAAER